MEEEYIYGSTKAKIKLALITLSGLLLFLVIKCLWQTYFPIPENDSIEAIESYIQAVANAAIYVAIILLCIYLYAAKAIYSFGKRIRESGQYPPPGADIPFTIKILKGKKALKQAKASYFSAIILISIGVLKLGASIYIAKVLVSTTKSF